MQSKLKSKGIKVLSLFFIDRVSNYVGTYTEKGIIKRLFDEEYRKLRMDNSFFENKGVKEVQASYFASYRKGKKGQEKVEYLDDEATNAKGRKAEKEQFELIMKKKQELLSFDSPVCFIFAHSALKEGWDNPNVFQICTLNQTVSVTKKRQEIGRGLRICVDQNGKRVKDDDQVNILTVIANESYETFANDLQTEYLESEGDAPPKPKPKRDPAKRNDNLYQSTEFKKFWMNLQKKCQYKIKVREEELLEDIQTKVRTEGFSDPKTVIQKGRFILVEYSLTIKSIEEGVAIVDVSWKDTNGNSGSEKGIQMREGLDLQNKIRKDELRGFVVHSINHDKTDPEVLFEIGEKITQLKPLHYTIKVARDIISREEESGVERFAVFNLVDRLAKATGLTKATCLKIFKRTGENRNKVFQNPDSFTNKLIEITRNVLADHVAENIEFLVADDSSGYELDKLFPEEISLVQYETVKSPKRGLYDKTQSDSGIEHTFILDMLEPDEKIKFFFKFPPKYKVDFPQVIGNYNPDWGIVREDEKGNMKIQLVRETKGTIDTKRLRFPHEKRKIKCATKHFNALGIDYRVITGEEEDWYLPNQEVGNSE